MSVKSGERSEVNTEKTIITNSNDQADKLYTKELVRDLQLYIGDRLLLRHIRRMEHVDDVRTTGHRRIGMQDMDMDMAHGNRDCTRSLAWRTSEQKCTYSVERMREYVLRMWHAHERMKRVLSPSAQHHRQARA